MRRVLWALTILVATLTSHVASAQTFTVRIFFGGGVGKGRVVSSPAGIDCTLSGGINLSGTCLASFNSGQTVTLTGTPDPNVALAWSGDCSGSASTCQVVATQNRLVNVSLTPTTNFPVTIQLTANGYGTIRSVDLYAPSGSGCSMSGAPNTCVIMYPASVSAQFEVSTNLQAATIFGGFGGACAGQSGMCFLPITGPATITASFKTPMVTITSGGGNGSGTVTSSPAPLNCSMAAGSSTVTGTCSASFPSQSQQNIVLTGNPAPGSRLAGWTVSDRSCPGTGTCSLAPPAFYPGTTASARFEIPTIFITGTGQGKITSSPTGIDCTLTAGAPNGNCFSSFAAGSEVTLTATATTDWNFKEWGGDCSGSGTCKLTMDQNHTLTATFVRPPVTLTLAADPAGTGIGSVKSNPAGIDCTITGAGKTGDCTEAFAFGTNVTLTATPELPNNVFQGWTPPCPGTSPCTVAMTQDRTVTASFRGTLVSVGVTGLGTGDGIITSSTGGMTCVIAKGKEASGCSAGVSQNTSVTLTADPQNGSVFGGWATGGCTGLQLTCTLTISQGTTISATFNAPVSTQLVQSLLDETTPLPSDVQAQLDRFGNKNNKFDLGDLLALLDRNNEQLSAATLAAILDAERARAARPSPRRRTP